MGTGWRGGMQGHDNHDSVLWASFDISAASNFFSLLDSCCFVVQGYAGPLPQAYMAKQLALAKRVVQRMREYGMTPVYPAFAGFVPAALADLYPEATLTPASNWCQFPTGYCCPYMLDPCDHLFAKIGSTYIRYHVLGALLHPLRYPCTCNAIAMTLQLPACRRFELQAPSAVAAYSCSVRQGPSSYNVGVLVGCIVELWLTHA